VASEVAHTFKAGAHPQNRDDDTEVGGNRLLLREQENATFVEVSFECIDGLVVGDDLLCKGEVLSLQCVACTGDCFEDELGHLLEVVTEGLKFSLEDLAHVAPFGT
jgi:hypothetical protein